MTQAADDKSWRKKVLQSRIPWVSQQAKPADVSEGLCDILLARENMLEDAGYLKVLPNHYIVELSAENYTRNYQPIEQRILKQWTEKLLECLMTANSRQGRREYSLGGRVQIEVRAATDLKDSQVRILYRIHPDAAGSIAPAPLPACLEMVHGRRRWPLHRGVITLGREASCDIYLDMPEVQQQRLVSGVHAYLACEGGEVRLFDGTPSGKPSVNGTYINNQRVPPGGRRLLNGEIFLLGIPDPRNPSGKPGSVLFRFYEDCKE